MVACLLQPSKCMWRGGEGTAAWRCVLALPLPVDLKQEGGTRRVKGVDGGKG